MNHGQVDAQALRVGSEALLGQMIAVIENGLMHPVLLESRTDRWLAQFVPLMVVLSVATGAVVWVLGATLEQAFVRALTVMVIACPCALGIAVPLARTAGLSKASRMGILVRESEAFERALPVHDIVFDKTGTLTHGRWILESITCHGRMTQDQALALAAGLEEDVDHAIARVIQAHALKQGLQAALVTGVRVESSGVRGDFQGGCWRIGSREFALGREENQAACDRPEALHSVVYLSRDGRLEAVFHFGDTLRESSPDLVRELTAVGYNIHLVSGDDDGVTRTAARQLGVTTPTGGCCPRPKRPWWRFSRPGGGGWPWSATASTTLRPWPGPISRWPCTGMPPWPGRPPP